MLDTARTKNWCYPRVPSAEKGRPNGCWYKAALNRLGYYTPPADTGITDDLDDPDFRAALYAFQRQATVYFGDTDIGPGTTTERVLMEALEGTDESAAYIWRTASDDKVRDEHRVRAGKTYTWAAPPDGDHPGDDYNCRCWAEPLNPSQHPWAVWAREQGEERREKTVQGLAPPMGLKDGITDLQTSVLLDAINPTWSPLDAIGFGGMAAKTIAKKGAPIAAAGIAKARQLPATLAARMRDTDWIRNASKKQLQKKFKHAKDFGIKGNQNKENLEAYRNALEKHVRSADTFKKPGTLHRKNPVTHYVNPKTGMNVMQDANGNFISGWKPSPDQMKHILRDGKLGGSK